VHQVANGKGLMIGIKGVVGRRWMGVTFWHLLHVAPSL